MQQITFDIALDVPTVTFTDIGVPGPRGKEGTPFTYDDLTDEQKADLLKPIQDSVAALMQQATTAKDVATEAAKVAKAALQYEGTWNAGTGVYPPQKTYSALWKITGTGTVAGTTYQEGGELIWNHTKTQWDYIPPEVQINSINGQTSGDVVISPQSIGAISRALADSLYAPKNAPLPSASDLGALPSDGTAKNSEQLDGQSQSKTATPNTVSTRDDSGDLFARMFHSSIQTQSAIGGDEATGLCFRIGSGSNGMRFASKGAVVDWLGTVKNSQRFGGKDVDTFKAETRLGLVPDTYTINGKRLNGPITLTAADLGLGDLPNYQTTNSYDGTSTTLLATQRAAYDAAAAPRLDADRRRKITAGTAAPSGGSDGDIYIKYSVSP